MISFIETSLRGSKSKVSKIVSIFFSNFSLGSSGPLSKSKNLKKQNIPLTIKLMKTEKKELPLLLI